MLPIYYQARKEDRELRFYCFLRESSLVQKDRYGPKTQWRDFERFVQNWPRGPHYVRSEDSSTVIESASRWNRPIWEQAIAEGIRRFKAGIVDAFLFGRVDRETRNLFASIPVLRMAIDAGVPIFFAQEKLYLDPKDPEAMEQYMKEAQDSIAYIRKFVKNTTPGRISRARDDQKLPCNTRMFGFDIVDGKRVVNQAQAAAIRQAVEITLKEGRPGAGRRWLNEHGWLTTQGKPFSTQTLSGKGGLFRNRALIGETIIRFKDEKVIIQHDAILDPATFERLQAVLDAQGVRERRTEFYALSGIAYCGCGARFESAKSGPYRYYRCRAHCGERLWRKDDFEWAVWNSFGGYLDDRQSRTDYLHVARQSEIKVREELQKVEREIEANGKEWKMLLDRDLSGYPATTVEQKKKELSAASESLQWQKAQIEAELLLLPQIDPADVEQELATLTAPWLLCDWSIKDQVSQDTLPRQQAEVLRRTLLQLSARVHVEKGDLRIVGRLPVGFGTTVNASGNLCAPE